MNKDEQEKKIYCWWVHYQWGLGAPEEFFEGLETGFRSGLEWMIQQGYVELTEKGKQYKPRYFEDKTKQNDSRPSHGGNETK